jgi:adenosylmethionine-8-amino-7-oxononanoate aminotransferase
MLPWFLHVPNTNQDPDGAADAIRAAIEAGPPQAVAAVVLEPVQNGGGCLVPPEDYWPQVREICDEYGVLLVADSTICAFGRVGSWFGTERFGAEPDIITFAKGLTSGYIPMGGVIVSDRVREALDSQSMYLHGATFGGHPVAAAVALTNIAIIEREGLIDNVLALENVFGDALRQMAESHPIVIDVRGIGFFWAIELQPAWPDGRPLSEEDYRRYFKDDLYHRLVDLGLLCRFDDRDSPVIQLAPALIADADVLARIVDIVAVAVSDLERALGYASSP